jgi:DNA-binding XRE family transcriptional regulator
VLTNNFKYVKIIIKKGDEFNMEEISNEEIAVKVREFRKREGLTQPQLCKIWQLGINTLVDIEKGRKELTKVEKVKYLTLMGEGRQAQRTPINVDRILNMYDKQFIMMQDAFVDILEKIKGESDIEKIKTICDEEIAIIKKDQQIGQDLNNMYDMKGNLI